LIHPKDCFHFFIQRHIKYFGGEKMTTAIPEETYQYQNDDIVFIEGLFYNQIMALSKQATKVA